ncbi:TATA element modulatory factor 1 [Dinochytrium kinnereticum]|nr:TATA element modulatory factor 1 [Dinochytrium kinnereticum]
MSSWLNSIASSVVNTISEVESRIDRALDIQATNGSSEKPVMVGDGLDGFDVGSGTDLSTQPSQYTSAVQSVSGSLAVLGGRTDASPSTVTSGLTSGLSSLRNLSTSLTTSLQAAATSPLSATETTTTKTTTANPDTDFFSSMLGNLTGSLSPPPPRKSQSGDGKGNVRADILSSILGSTMQGGETKVEERSRKSLSERLNGVMATAPVGGNMGGVTVDIVKKRGSVAPVSPIEEIKGHVVPLLPLLEASKESIVVVSPPVESVKKEPLQAETATSILEPPKTDQIDSEGTIQEQKKVEAQPPTNEDEKPNEVVPLGSAGVEVKIEASEISTAAAIVREEMASDAVDISACEDQKEATGDESTPTTTNVATLSAALEILMPEPVEQASAGGSALPYAMLEAVGLRPVEPESNFVAPILDSGDADEELAENSEEREKEKGEVEESQPPPLQPNTEELPVEAEPIFLEKEIETTELSVAGKTDLPIDSELAVPVALEPSEVKGGHVPEAEGASEAIELTTAPGKASEATTTASEHRLPPSIPSNTASTHPENSAVDLSHQNNERVQSLESELKHMTKVIEEREKQLISAMTENASLNETTNILRSQLEQLELVKVEENLRLESVVKEFTGRLGKSEEKVKELVKERDALKQQLTSTQGSLQGNVAGLMKQIAERDEKIKGLLMEGEKLSKNELKTSTILKKLRQKESETDRELKEFTKKLEASASDIADLKEKVARLTEVEKKLNESLRAVNELNEKQAKSIVILENQLSLANQDVAQMNALVERSRTELQEARKLQAEAATVAQSDALERELKINEQIHRQLEDLQKSSVNIESVLRKESLQRRLQEAEQRYEELEGDTRSGDQTLIRQIELLQNQQSIARRDWEQIEYNLTNRIHEAEAERASAAERERQLSQKLSDMSTKNIALELQVSQERHETARLNATLQSEHAKCEMLEKNLAELAAKIDVLKASHIRAMDEAKEKFKDSLKSKIEEERRVWEDRQRENERSRPRLDSTRPSEAPSATSSRMPSFVDSPTSPRSPAMNGTTSPLGQSFSGAPAVVIDRLHSAMKHYQGQVATLQAQLSMTTKTRDELAEELLKSTTEAQDGVTAKKKLEEIEKEKTEINNRFLMALELLGEKTEQVEELKNDMEDVKRSYRMQLDTLLKEIETLKSEKR